MKKIPHKKAALENAMHAARMHVEVGNAQKIAEAFKDVAVVTALEQLFKLAEKYRRENKMAKTKTILEAVALIDRKTGEETDIVLQSKGADTQLFVRRFTPAEIFDSPIVYQEILED